MRKAQTFAQFALIPGPILVWQMLCGKCLCGAGTPAREGFASSATRGLLRDSSGRPRGQECPRQTKQKTRNKLKTRRAQAREGAALWKSVFFPLLNSVYDVKGGKTDRFLYTFFVLESRTYVKNGAPRALTRFLCGRVRCVSRDTETENSRVLREKFRSSRRTE